MNTVTFEQMVEAGACDKSISRFKRLFGDEIEITPEVLRKVGPFFEWDCAATKLLSERQQEVYERLVEPAWMRYERDGNYRGYLRRAAMAWGAAYTSRRD